VEDPPAKIPFDLDRAMDEVREAVRPFPRAALFELYDAGHTSAFEQLIACMLSIRTRDETMLPMARALFAAARTPEAMLALPPADLDARIHASSFHATKTEQIREISRRALSEYGGVVPCDEAVLLSFPGVGPKCANLVLGIACGQPRIGVDIHVHRVTNRWGYVHEKTPEATMAALARKLPERYWVEINRLLVPFGKHICTGVLPKCSACPILPMCRQVGVEKHR
jgi:endonuclease-3